MWSLFGPLVLWGGGEGAGAWGQGSTGIYEEKLRVIGSRVEGQGLAERSKVYTCSM